MDLVVACSVVGILDEIGNDILHVFVQRKSGELKEEDVRSYVHGQLFSSIYLMEIKHSNSRSCC
jgi:hypothetical protein